MYYSKIHFHRGITYYLGLGMLKRRIYTQQEILLENLTLNGFFQLELEMKCAQ